MINNHYDNNTKSNNHNQKSTTTGGIQSQVPLGRPVLSSSNNLLLFRRRVHQFILTVFIFFLALLVPPVISSTMSSTASTKESINTCSDSDSSHNSHLSNRGKIILLGDSITQMSHSALLSGWGAYLTDIYQRRCDVYNRGFSGYNTNWFLEYITNTKEGFNDVFGPHIKEDVKLVTIFFGANDASDSILNPRHHVPIPQFQSNLKQIVNLCKQHYNTGSHNNNLKIIMITPPPICHKQRLQYQIDRYGVENATGELERTLELSGMYAKAVEEVADEFGYPCLNLWKDMQESTTATSTNTDDDNIDNDHDDKNNDKELKEHPWSKYLSDGLHLSTEGNLFVGERLNKLIHDKYPDIAVTPCPFTNYVGSSASKGGIGLGCDGGGGIGPWHDEIDHLNVETSFSSVMTTLKSTSSSLNENEEDTASNKRMKIDK